MQEAGRTSGSEIVWKVSWGKEPPFWFTLSFTKGASLWQEDKGKAQVFNWSKGSLKGMKVLLVEDNRVNVMVGEKIPEEMGH
ncbi:hypothetical protein D5R40_30045 [Okeania hirsuta]|uniref:Uncharacterized protein n=1 Tax=Okeania hirsuta TaxID=1458930 RepID=A0A3N6P8A4_9CYAN|nr:hypothetical protein [Okeania hirsuta]RQH24194.1 hypothetical protein D5R40_30045 [Okeania hirsuta]